MQNEKVRFWQPYLASLVILFIQLILLVPYDYVDPFQIPSYVLTYNDFGLFGRGLVGTVSRLLFGSKISNDEIRFLCLIGLTLNIILFSYIFCKTYNKIKNKKVYLILCLLYWLLPISAKNYMTIEYYNHMDVFLITIILIIACVDIRLNDIRKKYYLYTILSCIGILIHPNFILFGMPIVLVLVYKNYPCAGGGSTTQYDNNPICSTDNWDIPRAGLF